LFGEAGLAKPNFSDDREGYLLGFHFCDTQRSEKICLAGEGQFFPLFIQLQHFQLITESGQRLLAVSCQIQ
jgi:hypothetical protein